ncbi:hypothetical protein N7448_010229 [Penicillium atrosanguineum]|nr:hypothetical protein N7526_010159 [Penicillium atrosanguineum]KAJ5119560.1 hypothetical protein N7448_010229 [Penicillium atrosanguineum]
MPIRDPEILTSSPTRTATLMARHGKAKARVKRDPKMAKPSPHQFTMQQEALNTETHTRLWSNSNLRHKAVSFVSAGELKRSEIEVEVEVAFEDASPDDRDKYAQIDSDPDAIKLEIEASSDPNKDSPTGTFFFDSTGQQPIDTGLPNPTPRLDLSDSDDSSEDEVVFMGRKNNQKPTVIETDRNELQGILRTASENHPTPVTLEIVTPTHSNVSPEHSQSPATPDGRQRRGFHEEENDPLADYIANMDRHYHTEDDADSYVHIETEGGTGIGHTAANPGSSGSSITGPEIERAKAKNNDEAQVQNSIDVLSKMYLDTEPEAAVSSDDDLAGLDSDDSDLDMEDGDIDTELLEELAIRYSTQRTKGSRQGNHGFASASAFADALEADPYYGFDIMDFNRPSLQKKGKGKTPPALDLMLSDSDLEFNLHEAWQTDRKKKSAKKKEREELRSQGLLGRDPGDADLKIKYSKGMDLEELITEMRTFLLSSKTSLSLPPMTKNHRKTIHELANTLNLKSQSRGNGPARFPILVKTQRTPTYTRKTISRVDNLLSGRKLNRRLFHSWGSDGSKPTKSKRGAVGGAVSYMEGDVVGASAPEIGVENRGRAMLEKMGWSSGTALGASNNKGILQPVAQVVKNSRAGLG